MNGFQISWRGISAHESASTMGKKIANWTVGKSTAAWRPARRFEVTRRDARAMRQSTRPVRCLRGQGTRLTALVAALALALVALPATADAGCGGVRTAAPAKKQKRNRTRAPL